MESPKLKTLYDLLAEGYTVAQLATAVETHGIHGWDRFGRYDEHIRNSPAAMQALDALADFYEEEQKFWDRMPEQPPTFAEDVADLASKHPVEVARDFQALAIHHFGWPQDRMPAINRSVQYPQMPRHMRHAAKSENLLRIIGALLGYLADLPKPPSQNQVIGALQGLYPNVPGLGTSTLEKWFSAGKSALIDASIK